MKSLKFLIGGLLIAAAVIYLIFSSTQANAQYFLTIRELQDKGQALAGQDVRISGAVIGDSIQYDPQTLNLNFTVAYVPGDNNEITRMGGLSKVLHDAVQDKTLPRLAVVYHGVKPDLLKGEAQAIMTGKLGANGTFEASELLLKCPTRYEEALPNQAQK